MTVQSNLTAVLAETASAHGLPNEHYTSPGMHARERDAVLFAGWTGLAFAHEAPEPGDALPIDFMGMPLLLIHGRDGQLRVFQNTCRHRGMILVESARKIEGAIRCPYHSWCYDTAGALKSTPHVGGPGQNLHPGIDRSQLGLTGIASHVWMGVVFVNVSGTAAPFEEAHAELIARWSDFQQPLHAGGRESTFELELACNWKLAVENYCESYHLPWVHPGLNSYSRLEDHYNIESPGHYSGQGTLVYRPVLADDGSAFPLFPGIDAKWDAGAEYVALYPNVLLGVHKDHTFAILLIPRSHDRTQERVALFYAAPEAAGPAFEPLRQANADLWRGVFLEDVPAVEGMQRGRGAVHFDGGRFSPVMDGPTHCFHRWVAGLMQAAAEA